MPKSCHVMSCQVRSCHVVQEGFRRLRMNGHLKGNSLNLSASTGLSHRTNLSGDVADRFYPRTGKPLLETGVTIEGTKKAPTEIVPSKVFRVGQWRTKTNVSLRTMCHQALAAINWCDREHLSAPVWAPNVNDLRCASFRTSLSFLYPNIMAHQLNSAA